MQIENLKIENIEFFHRENHEGMIISWSANIGFGEYIFYKENGKYYADSEHMDRGEDKKFGKMLLELFLEEVEVH